VNRTFPALSDDVTRFQNLLARILVVGAVGAALLPAWAATAPAEAQSSLSSTVASSAAAPNGVAGTTSVVQLPFAGVLRDYRVFVPATLPSGPRPVLLALTGLGTDAAYFETTTNLDANAAKRGTLVVYPDGLGKSFDAGTCCSTAAANGVDDVGFVTAVIADVAARYTVDRNRLAMVGSSNGGMLAYRFACERSDLVDIYSMMTTTSVAPSCALSRPISLMHVHGLADTSVPFAGVATSTLDASGFPAVQGVVDHIASLDGCTTTYNSSRYNNRSDVTLYQATGCPANTSVQMVLSQTMPHVWTSSNTADATKYGVDMTSMTWGFSTAAWGTKPAPAVLAASDVQVPSTSSTVVSSSAAPNGAAGTTRVIGIGYGGAVRDYRLFVPTTLPAGPRPLLVALHGYTSDATSMESLTNLDANAPKRGALIAYPDGLGKSWNAGTCCGTSSADNVDDVGFLAAVIHDVAVRWSVDRNRLALVGGSNGGMLAYRFACERSDMVDVVTVMGSTNVAPQCSFARPVSLMHVHGLADTTVPFDGVASSPLDASGFPSVRSSVDGVASLDGCSSSYTQSAYNGRADDTLYQAVGCPAGTAVQYVVSQSLTHTWPATGSAAAASTGIDATSMTWGFSTASWASRPAPAAL
jgi:polyhydroxybutyrate depolymerase